MASKRPTVLVTTATSDEIRGRIEAGCDVVSRSGSTVVANDLPGLPPISGWLLPGTQEVDGSLLDLMPDLQVLSNHGVGCDNIDVQAATRRRVRVCNTPGVLDAAVAELCIGVVIAVLRGIVAADRFVRDGSWRQAAFPLSTDVHGKTLGIIGMGRIGSRVARAAAALELRVCYHNRRPASGPVPPGVTYSTREQLLQLSDVVLLLVPLNEQTRGSFRAADLAAMQSTSYLLNFARGAVLDESALVNALNSGAIAGAALDVMQEEPLPERSPLLTAPNLLLLPHIGSATVETRQAMMELAVTNLLAVLDGREPPAAVNRLASTATEA